MTTPRIPLRARRGNFVLIDVASGCDQWDAALAGTRTRPAPGSDPGRRRSRMPPGAQAPAGDPADPQDPQVLTRGPIHEAFAAPVVHDPASGPVIAKQPPDPIQEMPPDQKPSRPERPVDPGLLELGRLAQRLPLGQRHLARSAAQQPVGARLLASG